MTTDINREQLSALIDGEVDDAERQSIDDLVNQQQARATWQRYHLIRDVLQQQHCTALAPDFAARVQSALADEPLPAVSASTDTGRQNDGKVVSLQSARRRGGVWMPVAGLAVAASLVAMTVLSLNLVRSPAQPPLVDLAGEMPAGARQLANHNPVAEASTGRLVVGNTGTRWRSGDSDMANDQVVARLNSLLINHLEGAGVSGVHGMLPHARVVGYDSDLPEQGSF